MDIKKLIAAYEELQVDSMEDETGVNEIVEGLEEKPADMEQAEYSEIKIEEPEVEEIKEEIEKADYDEIKVTEPELDPAKKLLKQFEDLEVEEIKEEKIDEISLENAEEVNTQRQIDSLKKTLQWKKSGEEIDREIAKEAKDKATKSNELLKKWKKAKGYKESLEELNEEEYTDRVDVDFDISLYEYGVVRNPQNDQTLIGIKPSNDGLYTDYAVTYISLDDIKEVIENMEDGFFNYIDQPKEEILEILNNDHIAPYIQYVDSYNGYFRDQFYESMKEAISDYDDPQGRITLRDAKKEFEKLVKEADDIYWQGYKFIDITGLENACPAFTCINWEDIPELIRSWGYVVYEDEIEEPAIALSKDITEDDLKQMIQDFNKENGFDESLKDSLESLVNKAINEEDIMDTDIELIDSWLTKLGYEDAQGPQGYVFMKKDGENLERIVIDNNKLIYTKGEEKKEFPFSNTLEIEKAFKSLSESINEDGSLTESNDKYSICKDMEKGYFYICSEDDVYCDPDGEPYHFEDRKEAEEFLQGLNESLNEEVIAKFDEGKHEIVKCDKGYYNRYNIKEGKARFTTKCVESLPTALSALKKRFPKAEEDK